MRVSVLLPTYNCANFLPLSIESVLAQTYTDFELLIVDDGSRDNTKEVISQYLIDKRVKYLYKTNSGLGDTLNYAINSSKGEYLIRMDSDDISLPTRFEKLVNFMDSNSNIVACGSYVNYFVDSPENEFVYERRFPSDPKRILRGLLELNHVICHPSLIIRKDKAMECGMYQIKGVGEDWDFFLQLSKLGDICNYTEVLYLLRMNPNSITHTKWKDCFINNQFSVFRYRNNLDISYLESFRERFRSGTLSDLSYRLDSISLSLYRKGISQYIVNNKIRYFLFISVASLVSPSRLYKRLKFIFFNKHVG